MTSGRPWWTRWEQAAPGAVAGDVERFRRHVEQAARSSRRLLVVLDEAQALTSAMLAEVSRACDLARDVGGPGCFSILLVGQEDLEATLARGGAAARLAVRHRLPPCPSARWPRTSGIVCGASARPPTWSRPTR